MQQPRMISSAALFGCDPNFARYIGRALSEAKISCSSIYVQQLFGDGSDRKFFRVRTDAGTYVLLVSPRVKAEGMDETDSYFFIGRHLFECGVPVPEFFWVDMANGCFLMEDLGDCHLQVLAVRGRLRKERLYSSVLRLLVQLHEQAAEGFSAAYCFDADTYDPPFVYARELEYFRTAFLDRFSGLKIPPEALKVDFLKLAEAAGSPGASTVIHRDFQSRNIMVHNGKLRLIDFQGMRFGPPAYDLASVLVDPYVTLSPSMQEECVSLYWTAASRFLRCTRRSFTDSYRAARLCRNMQVLGAYGYLSLVKGKKQFLKFIPRAWTQLYKWINGPCKGEYPVLAETINRLNRNGGIQQRLLRELTTA